VLADPLVRQVYWGGREPIPAHGRRRRRRVWERERPAQGVASRGPRRNGFHRGRNGAGKTTLLKTIAGFMPPAAGAVRLEGRDLRGIRPEQVARLGVRYVFQDKRVFSKLTVRENSSWRRTRPESGCPTSSRGWSRSIPRWRGSSTARRGLERGAAADPPDRARAHGNPKILLVDEPTEGLAAGVIDDIFRLLSEMKGRLSMLIVEQNLPVVARLADRVYVMKEGKIFQEIATRAEIEATGALERNL